jgi:hypothetical protein
MVRFEVRERLICRAVCTAIVVAFVVAACGGSGTKKPDAVGQTPEQSSATTQPTSTTPTTIDPLTSVRDAYVTMEANNETGVAAVESTHESDVEGSPGIKWTDYPAWCADSVAVDEKWASDVAGFAWPTAIQPRANELVLALGARVDFFHHCAGLPGDFSGQHPAFAESQTTLTGIHSARDNLRSSLGLPSKN